MPDSHPRPGEQSILAHSRTARKLESDSQHSKSRSDDSRLSVQSYGTSTLSMNVPDCTNRSPRPDNC